MATEMQHDSALLGAGAALPGAALDIFSGLNALHLWGTEFDAEISYTNGGFHAGFAYGFYVPLSANNHPIDDPNDTGPGFGYTGNAGDAGNAHTCAVTSDGALACWGSNSKGQLGLGNTTNQNTPQLVTGGVLSGKKVVQVSAGNEFTCALTTEGAIACWGMGTEGQLGNSAKANSSTPVAGYAGGVLKGRTVTQISSNYYHACAVASGKVSCWGVNTQNGLGNGTTTDSQIPVNVVTAAPSSLDGKTVTQVSTGYTHSCARTSDGGVSCWGATPSRKS